MRVRKDRERERERENKEWEWEKINSFCKIVCVCLFQIGKNIKKLIDRQCYKKKIKKIESNRIKRIIKRG